MNGTGDQTSQAPFTVQSLTNMLAQLGVTVPTNVTPQLKNIAAVSVHAVLPAFVKPGQTIDITVNSVANARSLRGGSLLVTALHGLDGQIYAIAQGNLIVSGFGAEANDGSKITVNVPSSGRIPNGATVEKAVPSQLAQGDAIILNLNDPDFTTATRLVDSVNRGVGAGSATVIDGGSVRVQAPLDLTQRVAFLSVVENLQVEPASAPARVIINSRTGTVVISSYVTVESGRGVARLALGHHQGGTERESAGAVCAGGPDRRGDQFDHQDRPGQQSHVPVSSPGSSWSKS